MSEGISRFQRVKYGLTGGMPGHKRSAAVPIPGSSHWLGFCQCGWSERTLGKGSALGALKEHHDTALPWRAHDPQPYVQDDIDEHLKLALKTLGTWIGNSSGTDKSRLEDVERCVSTALDHYTIRLTQE